MDNLVTRLEAVTSRLEAYESRVRGGGGSGGGGGGDMKASAALSGFDELNNMQVKAFSDATKKNFQILLPSLKW